MTLYDTMNGPLWLIWVVFAIFAIFSMILLTGHGANLIAGYNTASEEEKAKFDKKKLCRVIGMGMLIIAVCIFVIAIAASVLPASFAYVFMGIVIVDCIVMMILANTVCRK